MSLERAVQLFAGSLVLLSVVLAWQVDLRWLLLTAFVGANLVQTSFTGFCPAALILRSIGFKSGQTFR